MDYIVTTHKGKILYFIIVFFGILLNSNAGPAIVEQPRNSINLGPCTWVLDRKCPDSDVNFYIYTRRNPKDRQLIYVDSTWETSNISTSYFNPYHPVKIIIHGYNADMFLHPLVQMKDEYLQRGEYNLIYVDWSNLSPGPCYISAVHNSRHTGACIAQLIERILEAGTANIHLIGFSLGAQVTNFVANSLGSFVIPRITGLDPAMPLFITASADNKLDPSDAAFVDVIHTNALVQGKIERCGHVDFYMNGGIMQPGCFNSDENPFACSHHRAPDYYAESIRSYKGFWGWSCSSYINYLLGLCPPTNYLILAGEDCRPDSEGMYLITTNDAAPFAKGKWIDDIKKLYKTNPPIAAPYTKGNPLSEQIDEWGKLKGSFNNIMHFPTPYSQDPSGGNWPYFGYQGTKEITQDIDDNIVIDAKWNDRGDDSSNSILKGMRKKPLRIVVTKNKTDLGTSSDRDAFLLEYKRNLTLGRISNDIFKLPEIT